LCYDLVHNEIVMKARRTILAYFAGALVFVLFGHVHPAAAQDPGPIRLSEEQAEQFRKICEEMLQKGGIQIEGRQPTTAPAPRPKGSLIIIEQRPDGILQRYEYGTTVEIKKSGAIIETQPDGVKIETLENGTKTVRWPKGGGFIRYPDGKGAEIKPDGELVNALGTIEITEDGIVLQRLEDEGVLLERRPDGSVVSKKYPSTETAPNRATGSPVSAVPPLDLPRKQVAIETVMVESAQSCPEDLLGGVLEADARTAGVPKPSAEVTQAESSKPGLFESLAPILIPSFSIGGARGREDSERRFPDRR
jgi:hypothetical protein